MIKIITWNILSPEISNYQGFINYNPDVLNKKNRLNQIIKILSVWVKQNNPPIINFQEVPLYWNGILNTFFHNNNFIFLAMNYGNLESGFVSIATAIPKIYKIVDIEYIPIGDRLVLPNVDEIYYKLNYPPNYLTQSTIKNSFPLSNNQVKPIKDVIKKADDNQNIAIKLILQKDYTFIIYNYHMPHDESVRRIHMNALKLLLCQDIRFPFILAGDMNFMPDSLEYNYITENELPEKAFIKKDCNLILKSAFKEVHRREPEDTIYVNTKLTNGIFRTTLDYIFISNQLKTIDSKVLLNTNQIIPNTTCPSDHMPLEATVMHIK